MALQQSSQNKSAEKHICNDHTDNIDIGGDHDIFDITTHL